MWTSGIYKQRFSSVEKLRKKQLWQTLVDAYLQRYVNVGDTVVDIGAGSGEFLEAVKCKEKVAIDPLAQKSLEKHGIKVITKQLKELTKGERPTADVILLSNVLEHLSSAQEVLEVLGTVRQMLNPGGKILIIQPVVDLVGNQYWDFLDHQVVLTRRSLIDAVESVEFKVVTFVPRFLPYTTKTRVPTWSWLLWIYLKLPWWLRVGAGQCFCVAMQEGKEKHR